MEDFRAIPVLVGDGAIMSTSDKPDLQYWKVEISGDDRKTWTSISTSTLRSANPTGQVWKSATVPDGEYWLRSVMVLKSGNFPEPCEFKVIVNNTGLAASTPSCKDARASITQPRNDSVVSQRISVYGSAQADNFDYAQIQYSNDQKNWSNAAIRLTTPVPSGLVGIWDASALPDGDYWLRVLVVDKSSNSQSNPCTVHVVLRNTSARSPELCGTSPTAYVAALQITPLSGPVTLIKSLQPPPVLSGTVTFMGSMNPPDFTRYIIQYSADQKSWVDASSSSLPQVSETGIGGLQTRSIPNGDYWLHIRIVNKTGNYQDICEFRVTIQN